MARRRLIAAPVTVLALGAAFNVYSVPGAPPGVAHQQVELLADREGYDRG
jgi:hypothetical protein